MGGLAEAVACYQCYSSTISGYGTGTPSNADCGEYFKHTIATVTHSNACMKVEYRGTVVRTAMTRCEDVQDGAVQISCCTTDYCNSSSRLTLGGTTIVHVAVLLYIAH